ncbi:MAG: 5'-nucleotidase C-terminal domain-containing protein [Oscillospiraceae bacterium]|nr:5'-nucleotidase C-terminal domain-containing protein [Oscillospiraceae bacterium]
MNKFRKLLAVTLALCMVFSLSVGVMADDEETAEVEPFTVEGDYTGTTVILHSNDVHGAITGYASIAALKADYEAAGAEVVLVDAGDYIQGSTYVSTSQGASAVELMNAVGYDIVTFGNHEFDYGYENLVNIIGEAEFDYISANILYNGEQAFDGSTVYTTESGLKIGFFGLETPETATKAHPAKIQGVTFLAEEEMYAAAQAEIDSMSDCDLVIGIVHLGVDGESEPNRSYDLWNNITGADFLIDGHSHTVMTAGDNGEPIQSTGTQFANIGVIEISSEGEISNYLVDLAAYTATDETVAAAAQAIIDEIEAVYGEVFATTEVVLNGERDPGVRTQATNLGDLITDALVWYVTKDGVDTLGIAEENIVGVTNGGGIRATIEAGDITMNDINTVLPFGNTVAVVYVSGAVLLESLEASTYSTPEAIGAYPQTSGIEFTIDTTVPYDQGEQYEGSTYYGPNSIQRVTITSINGQPFDENATYAVVTNDFLAAGGDTYYAFSVSTVMDTGTPMDEAVIAYITDVLGGTITAEAYGETRADQTYILSPFSDVSASDWFGSYVFALYNDGIVAGNGDGTYGPSDLLTWGQALKLLLVSADVMEASDVTGEGWAEPYVTAAVEAGYVEEGVDADADITRLDFCTLAAAVYGIEGSDAATGFTDCDDAIVSALVELGVINGNGDGTFTPDNTLSRAEISKIIVLLADTAAVTE